MPSVASTSWKSPMAGARGGRGKGGRGGEREREREGRGSEGGLAQRVEGSIQSSRPKYYSTERYREGGGEEAAGIRAVSYTHLTLPAKRIV